MAPRADAPARGGRRRGGAGVLPAVVLAVWGARTAAAAMAERTGDPQAEAKRPAPLDVSLRIPAVDAIFAAPYGQCALDSNATATEDQPHEPTPPASAEPASAEPAPEAPPPQTPPQHAKATKDPKQDKSQKTKTNYASDKNGARVVAANPGAKGAKALITENKDAYLITECENPRKWFVIELSQEVLAETIQLANYEFYSSTVRVFQVLGTQETPTYGDGALDNTEGGAAEDAEPGDEATGLAAGGAAGHATTAAPPWERVADGGVAWIDMGTFEVEEGELQAPLSFALTRPAWVRYLQVRILEHEGTERFCTLSLIRVYGCNVVESLQREMEEAKASEEAEVGDADAPAVAPADEGVAIIDQTAGGAVEGAALAPADETADARTAPVSEVAAELLSAAGTATTSATSAATTSAASTTATAADDDITSVPPPSAPPPPVDAPLATEKQPSEPPNTDARTAVPELSEPTQAKAAHSPAPPPDAPDKPVALPTAPSTNAAEANASAAVVARNESAPAVTLNATSPGEGSGANASADDESAAAPTAAATLLTATKPDAPAPQPARESQAPPPTTTANAAKEAGGLAAAGESKPGAAGDKPSAGAVAAAAAANHPTSQSPALLDLLVKKLRALEKNATAASAKLAELENATESLASTDGRLRALEDALAASSAESAALRREVALWKARESALLAAFVCAVLLLAASCAGR